MTIITYKMTPEFLDRSQRPKARDNFRIAKFLRNKVHRWVTFLTKGLHQTYKLGFTLKIANFPQSFPQKVLLQNPKDLKAQAQPQKAPSNRTWNIR